MDGAGAETTASSEASSGDSGSTASAERSGTDARRRGWFWHWNNVVTQYAPLIGLKGVGLLNSYTVWTDRRDESPHRGYAFPSQQSEADFYGEERAELITINKILVALDLIEIRKEMLTRVDERGRRWRVPHNLYRVKDRPDGVDLRAADVLRVATLAQRDDAVFRYVRRVFSERFRPIDGDNVWHAILHELRNDPTWRELQERTRAIEARASARTRAGHQNRTGASGSKAGSRGTPQAAATPELETPPSDAELLSDEQQPVARTQTPATSVEPTNTGSRPSTATAVGGFNIGSGLDVAGANSGLGQIQPTSVAGGSNGLQSVVGPGNTTYDQADLTTTTTTTSVAMSAETNSPGGDRSRSNGSTATEHRDRPVDTPIPLTVVKAAGETDADPGRVVDIDAEWEGVSSSDQRERRTAAGQIRRNVIAGGIDEGMEDERDRGVVSGGAPADQQVEATIEGGDDERGATAASARTGSRPRERGLADPASGGPLVDPGPLVVSTFEAANDRRATPLERHLLAELERDADPPARAAGSTGAEWVVAAMREAVASGSAFVAPKRVREIITRWSSDPRHAPSSPAARMSAASVATGSDAALSDEVADVRLPGGASGNALWSLVLSDLARALDRDAFDRLLAGSRITRYWRGTVEVHVAGSAAADKLSNEYRGLVERHLNGRLRRPVAVGFVAEPSRPAESVVVEHSPDARPASDPQPLVIAEAEVEIGRQVWQSLLGDLARVVVPADLDRLAGVVVLGQDATGAMLLGAPTPHARRLIDGRYRGDVESSLAALLGQPSPIRVLDASDWRIDGH